MKLAIMQPYLFPYIGYFQLINAVDQFVVYDNIEFTKKGWINRNRILVNGKDEMITFPLRKDSDYLDVVARSLAESSEADKSKILRKITESYRKAPYYQTAFPVIESAILSPLNNLFEFIFESIRTINNYLEINTPLFKSSKISIDHRLKGEEKVIAICQAMKADSYYNTMGGKDLYHKERFKEQGIDLHFLKTNITPYPQFNSAFVPALSIIDVIMFNSKEETRAMLNSYTLE